MWRIICVGSGEAWAATGPACHMRQINPSMARLASLQCRSVVMQIPSSPQFAPHQTRAPPAAYLQLPDDSTTSFPQGKVPWGDGLEPWLDALPAAHFEGPGGGVEGDMRPRRQGDGVGRMTRLVDLLTTLTNDE